MRVADILGACLVDPRASDQITHGLSDITRFRLMMIGAGHEEGIDADALRSDPIFKMALRRSGISCGGCCARSAHRSNTEILSRADSPYCGPEVLDFCRASGLDCFLGDSRRRGSPPTPRHGKLRRFKEFHDGAQSWGRVERIIARVEVGAEDTTPA